MKKAQTPVFLGIILVLIFVFVIYFLSFPFSGQEDNLQGKAEIQITSYTMLNALDAAKSYIDTALDYSVYQACYEILEKSGWYEMPYDNIYNDGYENYGIWYSDENKSLKPPSDDEWKEGLEKKISDKLRVYASSAYRFLDDYYVYFPDYDVSVKSFAPGSLEVETTANKNMWIKKTTETGQEIYLEKAGSPGSVYNIDCYGVYKKAKEKNSEIVKDVKQRIESILNGFTLKGKGKLNQKDYVIFYEINKNLNWLSSGTFEAMEIETTDHILDDILGKEYTEGDYKIILDVLDADTDIKTESTVIKNNEKTIKFTITFNLVLKVKVTNTNPDQLFPVFTGEDTAFAPLKLIFVDVIQSVE
ncbi:MAG: hypothetical protein DRP16_02320 [Candidatus Aenigmatarchaeota archaeon]|nr:MAG: hypothetical protein DRP16_02320 [Candidatus Aenigmarchaeota archaeon]